MKQKKEATQDTESEHWKKDTKSTKKEIKKGNDKGKVWMKFLMGRVATLANKKHSETYHTLVD